ncbi:MAG: glutamate-5-semialdehyde dehydrogenase [Clostridia bacterium]|nr:glutamate-5-semialdehyde dehydrogenase [Clostridia bacterium]
MKDITTIVTDLCRGAKAASRELAALDTAAKDAIIADFAALLVSEKDALLAANELDLAAADENGVPKVMLDRLKLTDARIEGIADACLAVCHLPDPCGEGERFKRPNGLEISAVRVPMGVVAMIYEARPNVTADAATLCIKSGNACVLRGGKEALHTNRAIVTLLHSALEKNGVSTGAVAFIDDPTREGTAALMNMRGLVDVLIPRGGKGLIRFVVKNAHIPVIETGAGNCHLYVDEGADLNMALAVTVNAKMQRPSVCNAIETLLVHEKEAAAFLPLLRNATEGKLILRGCARCCEILPEIETASETDYETEYNDYILACRVVDSIDEAIAHINRYNTGHSEAIMTRSLKSASRFKAEVDAAAVYVNASTRFTDGGEFGFGAEIGISTQKLHARGPMGLKALTTVKYLIEGDGQVRS